MNLVRRFFSDTRGSTAIEYCLIAVLMTVALVIGVGSVGNEVGDMFSNQDREIQKAFNRE